jgi:uncharacterized protein (DUF488 family)
VVVHTIGHSTHPLDDFFALLRAHDITQIADVRTVPKSRRHPHFSREALEQSLPAGGVDYRHFNELGGLRKARPDSRNIGWRHEGFRGYADYMETPQFDRAVDSLVAWAAAVYPRRSAVMCAEGVWWRCHRQLIADALVARGVEVRHILSTGPAKLHAITEFARIVGTRVTYPGLI